MFVDYELCYTVTVAVAHSHISKNIYIDLEIVEIDNFIDLKIVSFRSKPYPLAIVLIRCYVSYKLTISR